MYKRDNWVICDRCGIKTRRSETRKTWDNYIVCLEDFEPRQPQDFAVRALSDRQTVRFSRPRNPDIFKTTTEETELPGTFFVSDDDTYFVSDDDTYFTSD